VMLRKELMAKLPAYMVPSEWLELPALPKNANGKVDRPLLKSRFRDLTAQPRPRVDSGATVEGQLAAR